MRSFEGTGMIRSYDHGQDLSEPCDMCGSRRPTGPTRLSFEVTITTEPQNANFVARHAMNGGRIRIIMFEEEQ